MQHVIQANVEEQMARLQAFRHLLEVMFHDAPVQASTTTRLTLLFASVLKVTQSANAVELLSNAGCVEEVLSIGRTMVEVTVNAAYFQAAGDKEMDSFLHFHPESQFKQLGLAPQPSSRGFAARFVRKLGGVFQSAETRQADPVWSSRSILERARFADEQSKTPVMVPLVNRCYTRGQAAVYGNVASLESFMTSVHTMEAPRADDRMVALTEALFGVNLCLLTMCVYLNGVFKLHLDEAIDEAANAETLTRVPTLDSAHEPEHARQIESRHEED